MKEKIQNLIDQHKLFKQECYAFLEELNKVDVIKLSPKENDVLHDSKLVYNEELRWRSIFISELEDLL